MRERLFFYNNYCSKAEYFVLLKLVKEFFIFKYIYNIFFGGKMNKLKRKDFIHVSIMLFGLFFGAGNLIFPPRLGNQSGENLWIAFLGFAITAIVFPVVGAIVVGKTEGLTNLANRVGPIFALVFTTAIYISIGPGMGIPRAGSVPFEMAIAPYLPESFSINLARLVY